jgi:hypothetical protein
LRCPRALHSPHMRSFVQFNHTNFPSAILSI